MPFWRCYYHIVWATKNRESLITPEIEMVIFHVAQTKTTELECRLFAINGVADHVHVAVNIPPKLAVSDWVRQVKGATSHEINARYAGAERHFAWQSGYGALTFGAKALDYVVSYVEKQKEHHAQKQVEGYLERIEE